jgi:hypothetical protein
MTSVQDANATLHSYVGTATPLIGSDASTQLKRHCFDFTRAASAGVSGHLGIRWTRR